MSSKKDTQCDRCNVKFTKKDKSVCCAACGFCFHSACVNIDEALSDTLRLGVSGLHWFCDNCRKGVLRILRESSKFDDRVNKTELEMKVLKEEVENQTAALTSLQKSMADLQCTLQTHFEEDRPSKTLWTDIVNRQVEQKIGTVQIEVQEMHKAILTKNEQLAEEKDKEGRKNNIIVHKMPESKATDHNCQKKEDMDFLLALLKEALKVEYETGDVKRISRLGRSSDTNRPLLVEFSTSTVKNTVMESLGKLRGAEDKYKGLSIVHDRTKKEREELKKLVQEAKDKQEQDKSGEWIYRVRGSSSAMRIVKLKRRY